MLMPDYALRLFGINSDMIFMQFFAKAGFPCPSRRNPSDHFLRCINSDFETVTTAMMASRGTHVYNDLFYVLLIG